MPPAPSRAPWCPSFCPRPPKLIGVPILSPPPPGLSRFPPPTPKWYPPSHAPGLSGAANDSHLQHFQHSGFFIFPHLPHRQVAGGHGSPQAPAPPKEQACTWRKQAGQCQEGTSCSPKCPRAAGQQRQRVQVRKRDAGGLQARPETEQASRSTQRPSESLSGEALAPGGIRRPTPKSLVPANTCQQRAASRPRSCPGGK